MIMPTIKIKTDRPKGYRIINLSDFDPAKHVAFDGDQAPVTVEQAPKKRGRPAKNAGAE